MPSDSVHVHNHLLSDASGEEGYYTGPVMDMTSNQKGTNQGIAASFLAAIAPGSAVATSNSNSNTKNINKNHQTQPPVVVPLLPHGTNGDFRYSNGRRYKGDWKEGKWHGYGQAWFTNGDSYEGQYVQDQRHGKGLYRWRDGRIYEGDFYKDLRHGEGRYQWLDGTIYQGAFEKGQQHGKGTCTFKDGTYAGCFDRGQYHGYGVCTYNDGRTYKGEWANGMKHGHGTETDTDGGVIHQGQWCHDEPHILRGGDSLDSFPTQESQVSEVDEQQLLKPVVNIIVMDSRDRKGTFRGMLLRGVPHSVGHMLYHEGDFTTYQGFWDYGDWKQGRLEYRNGDTYDGEFENNLRSGVGCYIWADGRQYEGEWKADVREGQGCFRFPNGDLYEGSFVAGARHGFGCFKFHDTTLFEGSFKKGEFHGHGCKYVHRDGRVYLGDFADGARNGQGKELYPNGSLRYEGQWVNDDPLLPAKIQPPPEGFVLLDVDEPERTDSKENVGELEDVSINSKPTTTSSIYNETKDCKTVVDETIQDAVGNNGKYTGLVLNGRPHGVGRMVYTGEIREGFWRYGHLDGHARAFFELGDFYEGNFENSLREGQGVYKWSDGRVYEGEYKLDQRHGYGHFVYPSGDEYVGLYKNGMRCGKGKFTFADGSSYVGEWKDSLYHGYGELKNIDGSFYKGEWQFGRKHGMGLHQEEGNGVVFNGKWENDEFIKAIEVDAALEEKEATEPIVDASLNSNQVDHCLGLLDGENHRWQPSGAEDDIGIEDELSLDVKAQEEDPVNESGVSSVDEGVENQRADLKSEFSNVDLQGDEEAVGEDSTERYEDSRN